MVYKGLKNLNLDMSLTHAILVALLVGIVATVIVWSRLPRSDDRHRRIQLVLVESNFKYIQVLTAAYVAFAHGSNDVANSVGPLAGIWAIYHKGLVGLKVEVPI